MGLVDAVMFILTMLAEKGRGRTILDFVRKTPNEEKAREFIGSALPPVVTSVLKKEDLENMRKSLLEIPESNLKTHITMNEVKIALKIFLLVFLSTFPVALPFALFMMCGLPYAFPISLQLCSCLSADGSWQSMVVTIKY